ncbi:ankyrin repeat-containing protein [Brachyspira hampsonii 30599]|nr:ankyrin repeat-containing protein [Brachyspira hampsonii 30599]
MKASENGHINVVRLLIDAGAKVNLKDRKDKTALTYASEEKHKNIVSLLKAAGGK